MSRCLTSFVFGPALLLAIAVGIPDAGGAGATPVTPLRAVVQPDVEAAIQAASSDDSIPVIVKLKDQTNVTAIGGASRADRVVALVTALKAKADAGQADLAPVLQQKRREGLVKDFIPFWVFNGFAVSATAEVIQELAARPEVLSISLDRRIARPAFDTSSSEGTTPVEANIAVIGAPAVWELGFRGRGIVVANMDTGVDVYHPDLLSRWRGGSNSWFDPNGQHPATPTDVSGHGTWTMGVMVGGEAGGTNIGVAPDARWVGVKIFDDGGTATVSRIHMGFQWLLDPDGQTATPDAPHIVNNSWGFESPGCDLEFQPDLQALQAAWIVPVFAAGNSGPASGTSVSPANNPEALAVGATDNAGIVYPYSSRGPSACGEQDSTYPELVAPGVGVRTTDLYGGYYAPTGTSLAAPHVAGGLALLLSAFPNVPPDQVEAALVASAVDLGPPGPDNDYGYGGIDVWAAFQALAAEHGTPVLMGDVDCDREVTTADASAISHIVVGLIAALPCPEAADVDRDGRAAMRDALLVGRLAAGLIDNFPPP